MDAKLDVTASASPCGPGCKRVGCCNLPKGVRLVKDRQVLNMKTTVLVANLIDEVNDVTSNVFETSNSDHGDNEELDDGTWEVAWTTTLCGNRYHMVIVICFFLRG